MIRPERLEQYEGKLPKYFLLDEQQRVTALASVFLPREKLKVLLAEIEEDMPHIFCNLKRFPEELEATTDSTGYSFPWAELQEVLAGDVIRREEIRRRIGEEKITFI